MFKKIFKFLRGYVIIEIVGKNKERFLNMCLCRRIEIFDPTPRNGTICAEVYASDFAKLRPLARKSGIKVGIVSKHSARRFLLSRKNRVALPVFVCILAVYCALVSNYIWCVEIDGIKTADAESVEQILRDKGVYVGARKSGIDDLSEIKNALIFSDNKINWAWLYIEGAKARLAVQESVMPPAVADKTTPTDIIAACDGFVREATVKRGERHVSEGMVVSKGQALVSGKVAVFADGTEERYSYVNSEARIIADTVRYAKGTFGAKKTISQKTGQKKTRVGLEIFGKEFFPFGKPESAFSKSETARETYDLTLPHFGYGGIGLCVVTAYEINEISYTMNEYDILKDAREKLEEEIAKSLPHNAKRLSQSVSYKKNGDLYEVVLRMRLRENIGIKIPTEE